MWMIKNYIAKTWYVAHRIDVYLYNYKTGFAVMWWKGTMRAVNNHSDGRMCGAFCHLLAHSHGENDWGEEV
jgi:hypothetical protein